MDQLKAHPFFDGIDFNSDLTQLGVGLMLSQSSLVVDFNTKIT